MRVRYDVPVVHRGDALCGAKFTIDDRHFTFRVADGKLASVSVEVPDFPSSALPKLAVDGRSKQLVGIELQRDPIWPDVERLLMVVEGVMAIYGLERFVLEEVETEWIPDSEAEKKALELYSFRRSVTKADAATPVMYDMFLRALLIAPQAAGYEVALNFMRRGREDLYERRYVDAVYDFYLALETTFANGAFKKNEVVRRMLADPELVSNIEAATRELAEDSEFVRLCTRSTTFVYLGASPEAIVKHLVEVRGLLHHHTSGRTNSWHPSRQDEFRMDAVFLAQLCLDIFNSRVTTAMFSEPVASTFARTEVRTVDGKLITFVPWSDD